MKISSKNYDPGPDWDGNEGDELRHFCW